MKPTQIAIRKLRLFFLDLFTFLSVSLFHAYGGAPEGELPSPILGKDASGFAYRYIFRTEARLVTEVKGNDSFVEVKFTRRWNSIPGDTPAVERGRLRIVRDPGVSQSDWDFLQRRLQACRGNPATVVALSDHKPETKGNVTFFSFQRDHFQINSPALPSEFNFNLGYKF